MTGNFINPACRYYQQRGNEGRAAATVIAKIRVVSQLGVSTDSERRDGGRPGAETAGAGKQERQSPPPRLNPHARSELDANRLDLPKFR